MSDDSPSGVATARDGAVLVVHLDDGRANAITLAMCAAVTSAVRAAEADAEIKAVVLHGRPGRFSGGFDMQVMSSGDMDAITQLVSDGAQLVRTLYGSPLPIVIGCTGHAVAMGALLLLAGDVRIGPDTDAKIGVTEVSIGHSMPGWAVTMVTERLARRHLQRAALGATIYSPPGAVEVGYLDEVVPEADVLDRALQEARRFAESIDPRAYATTMRLLRGYTLATLDRQIAELRQVGPPVVPSATATAPSD